jgi:hypothetical protein
LKNSSRLFLIIYWWFQNVSISKVYKWMKIFRNGIYAIQAVFF